MHNGTLQFEFVSCDSRAELAAALPVWREFVDQGATACGFWCAPEVVASRVAFEGGQGLVLGVVRRASRVVALLPFKKQAAEPVPILFGLLRIGALRVDVLRLYDGEFAVDAEADRLAILVNAFRVLRAKKMADVAHVDNCVLDRRPGRWGGIAARNGQPTYLADVDDDFEAYLGRLRANTRQTLRRRVRKMQKECHDRLRAVCFRSADEMERCHAHLGSVWKRSWHGKLNRQPPPEVRFLKTMAAAGWMRSYVLFAGDEAVASVLGFQYKGKFLDEAPAYDERWRRFSPGLVLNYFIMEDLFRRDTPRVVDFGFGYNQYKEMLGTRKEMRAQLWMAITPRGHVLVATLRACDVVYKSGKRVLDRTGVVRKVKARMRGRGKQ